MLSNKLNVTDLLVLWGDWEARGRNYAGHLELRTRSGGGALPALSDENAKILCDRMAIVKRKKSHHYKILDEYYVLKLSSVRLATVNKTNRHRAMELVRVAEGYCEAVFDEV